MISISKTNICDHSNRTSGVITVHPSARRSSNDSSSMTGSCVFPSEPCYNPDGRRSSENRRPGSRYASANSVQVSNEYRKREWKID